MKISTKGRYAVRIMLDLAENDTGDYIKVKSIAKRQDLSEKYLEQIISMLNKAGFVKSVRGARGGYRLSKAPEDFTIGMILRLMEGSVSPAPCLDGGMSACSRCSSCGVISVWEELQQAINGVVDNITLQDLLDRKKIESVNI
ncbi:Rrf2 family transcriptional regulator [bacterium C-53]|nr:Rrf2 family transcriptional regulator [Lachnospiraceae bacterium]NBI01463.1 Rrf2 family transcriptional regulator [Lachnospiraceae bacterium]RKJ12774.1 Rrf2 family transcriptional regulator [bacterium C-53]